MTFSKNNLFFHFLILGYIFGVLFYDFLGFNYTDELMAAMLVLFSSLMVWQRKSYKELIPIIFICTIFIFYVIYSLIIGSNMPVAIIKDAIIQIKPFLGLYCVIILKPSLDKEQKKIIVILTLVATGFLALIGLVDNVHYNFFGHPSRFATAITVTAFLFFYCSSYTWSDVAVFLLILSVGFFSTRTKFYGFWGLTVLITLYYKYIGNLKLSLRTVLFGIFAIAVMLFLSWEKIVLYYIDGAINSREMWSRPVMFVTSYQIFLDYIPFGSGLASFGTFMSGEYYSLTYAEYGIDNVWGLSKDTRFFISDAFYPGLAQFGIIGVVLYVLFWYSIISKAKTSLDGILNKQFIIVLLIFFFFLIEGVADSTFTHNRGLFILIIMGMSLSDITRAKQREI